MRVKSHFPYCDCGQRQNVARNSKQNQQGPRYQKEPSRAVYQEETQRSPAVAKSSKVRRMRPAAVRMQCDGNFGDSSAMKAGFDDHLGGKLHPRASLIEPLIVFSGKASQPA